MGLWQRVGCKPSSAVVLFVLSFCTGVIAKQLFPFSFLYSFFWLACLHCRIPMDTYFLLLTQVSATSSQRFKMHSIYIYTMMLCVCVSVCAYLRKHHVDAGVQWRERWSIFKTLVCCSGRFPLSFRSSHQRVVATASDVAKTVARKNNNSGDLKPTAICMARTADHATGTMRRPAAAATASAALLPRQHERNYENTREKRWSTIRVCSRLLTYDHRRRVLFLKVILF